MTRAVPLLLLALALPAGASPLEDLLERVAADRSPRIAAATVRQLAAAPLPELLALLAEPRSTLRIARGDAGGDERVQLVLAEAIARRADPAASAALRAVLADPGRSPHVAAAAAGGLGRICGPDEAAALAAALDAAQGDLAALAGVSRCRSRLMAGRLVARLARARSAEEIDRLAVAAGRLGSSWAWQALGPSRAEEGREVRRLLATALSDGQGRSPSPAVSRALRMIDGAAIPVEVPDGLPGAGSPRP